jgi:hypothetical protein
MIVSMIEFWLLLTLDRHRSIHGHHNIRDQAIHHALHEDLVNHIWIHVGNNPVTNHGTNPV